MLCDIETPYSAACQPNIGVSGVCELRCADEEFESLTKLSMSQMQGKSLGLTSMRERIRLVNGTIAIDSAPMRGTTIHVCVPIGSKQAARREAV